jgi:hypothetical protein
VSAYHVSRACGGGCQVEKLASPKGKGKLIVLLCKQGFQVSNFLAGRIIHLLKECGIVQEPVRNHVTTFKRIDECPYSIGKRKDYVVRQPRDLVKVDGDSEFQAAFKFREECQRQSIKLFVLPPKSPKLNDCMERTWWKHEQRKERLYH